LVSLVAIPIVLVAYTIAVPFLNKYWYLAEAEKDKASSLCYEIFQSIRIVVAFGAEKRLATEHSKIMERARKIDRKQAPVMGAMFAPMFLAIYGIFALTFWFGVHQYYKGKIHNVGTIIVVLFSVLWAVMSIYHLYNPIIQITRAASASAKIFAIIDAKIVDESHLRDKAINVGNEDIVFRDVTFAYPTRPEAIILNKLNLRFERGKTTAIVGPSGSGKSTLVGLIEKWYQPFSDSARSESHDSSPVVEKKEISIHTEDIRAPGIYIGDVNLKDINSRWWRTNIGLVQQEPALFNTTIFENVANGLAGTADEHAPEQRKLAMVQNACREALAEEFINKLPEGYNTKVGEGGLRLSGGQRQRVAIARAIIQNPSILILDEATSAIDVRTERLVQSALDRVSNNRTTIVIAHRLSTIQKADRIIVLRSGRVIEEGVHRELVERDGGFYRTLVKAQSIDIGNHDTSAEEEIFEMHDASPEGHISLFQAGPAQTTDDAEPQPPPGGFLKRLTLLIREQRSKWVLYSVLVVAAMAGSGSYSRY
jgi:ATP-binding cassette subfamily B (MDR/TAP) protein 1